MIKNILFFLFLVTSTFLYSNESIAVIPFETSSNVKVDFSEGVMFKLEHFLLKYDANLVSRGNLDKIMKEQKLQLSGLISNESAIKIGKILLSTEIISGYIEKRGMNYIIFAQKINVETGKISNSFFIEVNPFDKFFTKSIDKLAAMLMSKEPDNISNFKIEQNTDFKLLEKQVNSNKITLDYLDQDRFISTFLVIDESNEGFFIKGEIYLDDELFDIYQKSEDLYPSTTEDIMYFIPKENLVILTNDRKTKVLDTLSKTFIETENGKYFLKNATAVAYANRINDDTNFIKTFKATISNNINSNETLKKYEYNIITNTFKFIENYDNNSIKKVESLNFTGSFKNDDISFMIPLTYRIKLKNGMNIRYYDPKELDLKIDEGNKEFVNIIAIPSEKEKAANYYKTTLHSGIPEDPYFFDEIKDPALKERFLYYYKNKRWYIPHVKSFSFNGRGLENLSSLKGCTNLERLTVYNNNISNLTPLKHLKNLTTLDLRDNKVSDVSSLVNLQKLEYINLNNNKIRDLTNIGKIKNLTHLYLENNRIFDISPLKKLKFLEKLELEKTRVSDLSPIQNIKTLTWLNLSENRLFFDCKTLENIKSLEWLNLSGTSVIDISSLSKLQNLKSVNISYTRVTDISPLEELKFLEWFNINETKTNTNSFINWKFVGNLSYWDPRYNKEFEIEPEEKIKLGIKDGHIINAY